MAESPADLAHVMSLLADGPPAGSAPPAGRRGAVGRRGGGGRGDGGRRGRPQPPRLSQAAGGRGHSHGSTAAPSKRQPSKPARQQQQQQQHTPGSSSSAAAAPQQQQQPASPYAKPGPQSTFRVWHCAACDVWVPKREGDWEVHCRGIRHQRQLLSLRVTGQRGKLVLSAFESAPGPSDPAYRLVGSKGAAQFGLAGAAPSGSGTGPLRSLPAQQQQAVKRLHTQALAQLLNLFGVGQTYNVAAQELSEQQLASALRAALAGSSGVPSPAAAAAAADVGGGGELDPPGSREQAASLGGEQLLLLQTAAAAAAAAHAVQQGSCHAARLHLIVDLEGQPFSGVAATLAALQLLLAAFASTPTLDHLAVSLRSSALGDMPVYQLSQLSRAWGAHVVQGLGQLLTLNPALRTLRLTVPSCLASPSRQQLPALQAAASSAPIAARQHLLMALHPRAGRCSVLQLLPLPLVHQVMELAAPLQPCHIQVEVSGESEGEGQE